MDHNLFGPEWYAFLPYHYCQPSRRVVKRENVPAGFLNTAGAIAALSLWATVLR
jgi:hypothetical protein